MKKYVNGKYIEMTAEEIAVMQEEAKRAEAQERHRPLTEQEVASMFLRQQVNLIEVDDQTAVRMTAFYPNWEDLIGFTAEKTNFKFQYGGKLYKTIQANHTFQNNWIPGVGTEALYTRIDEVHMGDIYDPIPYEGNMALVAGHYYSQNGVVYLCTRDTGNPVYNALSELVGLYVENAQT